MSELSIIFYPFILFHSKNRKTSTHYLVKFCRVVRTDIINHRDDRELGQITIEDARLPVWTTKFSWIEGNDEINFVFFHEFLPNKRAPSGSDFDPYITLRSPDSSFEK